MKAIITQRQYLDPRGIECDLLESEYVIFFRRLGIDLLIQSNFQPPITDKHDLVILTGGGSLDPTRFGETSDRYAQDERDTVEKALFLSAVAQQVPVIGICRGMQHINVLLGGRISSLSDLKIARPIGVDHEVRLDNSQAILVNNFHDDGVYVDDLAKGLAPLALDVENKIVEAFCGDKILGLQWHPERKFQDPNSKHISTKIVEDFILGRLE
ncbi:MAG: gamma-glutamyl-gamma-aminobutyrate hydrolase family protein [Holosporales bacterium]|nr:gamma-glutamyl-gamma-aminobutyrate hydrolase family protein [Holosporales bacterium]